MCAISETDEAICLQCKYLFVLFLFFTHLSTLVEILKGTRLSILSQLAASCANVKEQQNYQYLTVRVTICIIKIVLNITQLTITIEPL